MPVVQRASTEVATWAQSLVTRARADYEQRNALMLGIRRQRFLRARPKPPQVYQRFLGSGTRIPIAFRLIQTVVGAVAGEERPRWHVTSPNVEVGARAEKWLKLIQQRMETVQPGQYWRFWDSLAGDGMVVLKTTRRPWTEFPQRLEGETDASYNKRVDTFYMQAPPIPFRTRVLDPMTFFPPRSEWGEPVVIEHGLRPYDQVLLALRLKENSAKDLVPMTPDEPIPTQMTALGDPQRPRTEVSEIWSPSGLLVNVRGQVFEYPNTMGQVPYKWAFGSAVAFSDPTLQAMSAAFPLLYIEPWINQTLSTLVGHAQLQATPTPTTVQKGGPGGKSEPTITDFHPGMLHQFGSDVVPGVWDMGKPRESIETLNVLVQLAERFTISPVPTFAGTRTAGTVMAQVAERIMSILRPMVDQAQVVWGEQGKMWVELIRDVIKAPVFVSGLTFEEKNRRSRKADTALTPKDIRQIGDIHSEIRFRTTTDKIAWDTHNVMMQQSGVWSMKRTRLESDVEDPEAEDRQVTIEELMQDPAVKLWIAQRGMEDIPPLQALQTMIAEATEGGGGAATGQESGEPSGRPPGATTAVPRAPGGTRQAVAPKGRMRGEG
jgi:hypothetical protein